MDGPFPDCIKLCSFYATRSYITSKDLRNFVNIIKENVGNYQTGQQIRRISHHNFFYLSVRTSFERPPPPRTQTYVFPGPLPRAYVLYGRPPTRSTAEAMWGFESHKQLLHGQTRPYTKSSQIGEAMAG